MPETLFATRGIHMEPRGAHSGLRSLTTSFKVLTHLNKLLEADCRPHLKGYILPKVTAVEIIVQSTVKAEHFDWVQTGFELHAIAFVDVVKIVIIEETRPQVERAQFKEI